VALAVAYLLVFGIPRMIEKERKAESQRNTEMEERAQERAKAATTPRLTGGRAGFGGEYTERALDNSERAANRSAEEIEENEEEPAPPAEEE